MGNDLRSLNEELVTLENELRKFSNIEIDNLTDEYVNKIGLINEEIATVKTKILFAKDNLDEIKKLINELLEFSDESDIKKWLLMHDFDPERISEVWTS